MCIRDRFRAKSQPRKRIVLVVAEDLVERLRSVPADMFGIIIGHQHDVCPAVVVSDRLERLGESAKRAGNSHHSVVGHRILQRNIGAPLREEWTIPVRQDVSDSFTHCIRQYTTSFDMCELYV